MDSHNTQIHPYKAPRQVNPSIEIPLASDDMPKYDDICDECNHAFQVHCIMNNELRSQSCHEPDLSGHPCRCTQFVHVIKRPYVPEY